MEEYEFERFVQAQASCVNGYASALDEVRGGRRRTRWVCHVFPVLKGVGRSYNSDFYGFTNSSEARAYLFDATLGSRLREISQELLRHSSKGIKNIFGVTDSFKVWACMTLFDFISPNDVFGEALDVFYGGKREAMTRKRLARESAGERLKG